MFTYKYPHPAVTSDCVLFGYDSKDKHLKLLLIQRGNDPYKGKWAFPGGFINIDETAEQCCVRELQEETGLFLDISKLEQVGAYSEVDRDPRERVITIAFMAILDEKPEVKGGDDAMNAKWFDIRQLPNLAFDHKQIYFDAMIRLNAYFNQVKDKMK